MLAPSLLGQKTSNLFVYGKTGTGKTLSIQHVANELSRRSKDSKILRVEYLNHLSGKLARKSECELYPPTSKQKAISKKSFDLLFPNPIPIL